MPVSTKRRTIPALAAVSFTAAGILLAPPALADAGPTVTFADDFNGSSLDTSKWLYTLGTAYEGGPAAFGTGEIETNTSNDANASVHDGSLYITPTQKADGTWESARIESVRADFKPAEGSVMTTTFRAALPDVTEANGSGYWPALWMNGAPYRADRWSWPAGMEFDIGETVSGGQWSNSVLHCGYKAQWGGPCNEPSGINAGSVPLAGAWGSFNNYSFQWDRSLGIGHDQMRWYHNDQLTQTVNQGDLPADVWASGTEHQGSYIIMNVAIDGAYPAAQGKLTNANTKPGVPMRVDSVSVTYSAGGSVPPPVEPPVVEPPVVDPPVVDPPVVTPPITDPPVTTGDFHASQVTADRIDLTWHAVPGADHYVLLRAGVALPPVVGWTTTTTISDVGLVSKTPYIESIQAVAADGTVLSTTPELTITTT